MMHFGRAWQGHEIEDRCPCHKAPCGLVDEASDDCNQHAWKYARTMRQGHDEANCQAVPA